jgi:hypothetical protein
MERTVAEANAKKRDEEIRKEQLNISRFLTGLVVTANLLLVMISILLDHNLYVVLANSILVFAWALLQMVLSAIFLIKHMFVGMFETCRRFFHCSSYTYSGYLQTLSGLTNNEIAAFVRLEQSAACENVHSSAFCGCFDHVQDLF